MSSFVSYLCLTTALLVSYYSLTTPLLVSYYCLTTALIQIFNERATPELSDWDRYAKIEYQRLAMEEDQVFLCVPICVCITYTDKVESQRLAVEEDR